MKITIANVILMGKKVEDVQSDAIKVIGVKSFPPSRPLPREVKRKEKGRRM